MTKGRFPSLQVQQMREWLRAVAESGDRCPTNDVIADRFGFASSSTSADLLRDMEQRGIISVERFQHARVVTVVADGVSTARPANAKAHWRDAAREPAPVAAPAPAEPERRFLPIAWPAKNPAMPQVTARIVQAAYLDGRDIPTFLAALVDMGLDCWRADRAEHGEPFA